MSKPVDETVWKSFEAILTKVWLEPTRRNELPKYRWYVGPSAWLINGTTVADLHVYADSLLDELGRAVDCAAQCYYGDNRYHSIRYLVATISVVPPEDGQAHLILKPVLSDTRGMAYRYTAEIYAKDTLVDSWRISLCHYDCDVTYGLCPKDTVYITIRGKYSETELESAKPSIGTGRPDQAPADLGELPNGRLRQRAQAAT